MKKYKNICKALIVMADKNVKKSLVRFIYYVLELILMITIIIYAFLDSWITVVVLIPFTVLLWLIEKLLAYFENNSD